jgi:hypothetical protein
VMWPRAAAVAELFWTGSSGGRFPRSECATRDQEPRGSKILVEFESS